MHLVTILCLLPSLEVWVSSGSVDVKRDNHFVAVNYNMEFQKMQGSNGVVHFGLPVGMVVNVHHV
jgi:hypothetical protein